MKMNNIILFGQACSGKSSVARLFEELAGYTTISIGRKIHNECALHGKETRGEMQAYGDMMRRIFGEDVWCDYINKAYCMNPNSKDSILIDDGRVIREFQYFKALGYTTVAIYANEGIRQQRHKAKTGSFMTEEQLTHPTEEQAKQCLGWCDYGVDSNYSMDVLRDEVLKVITCMKEGNK